MDTLLGKTSKGFFERQRFVYQKTIKDIENYANACFKKNHTELSNKPFYHYNEWFGWRFYLKAIRYKDWKSIKGHILGNWFKNLFK